MADDWLLGVERLAERAVGSTDSAERAEADRRLRKWFATQQPEQTVVTVLTKSQSAPAIFTTLLLARPSLIKSWNTRREQEQLTLQHAATTQPPLLPDTERDVSDFIIRLFQILVERFAESQPPDVPRIRRQVLRLIALLNKKAWAHLGSVAAPPAGKSVPGLDGSMEPCGFAQLCANLLKLASEGLTIADENRSQPESLNRVLLALETLLEMSREMSVRGELGSLGISLEEYTRGRRLFQSQLFAPLALLGLTMLQKVTASPLAFSGGPRSGLTILSLELLEAFTDWNFSAGRVLGGKDSELYVQPTKDFGALMRIEQPDEPFLALKVTAQLYASLRASAFQQHKSSMTEAKGVAQSLMRKTFVVLMRFFRVDPSKLVPREELSPTIVSPKVHLTIIYLVPMLRVVIEILRLRNGSSGGQWQDEEALLVSSSLLAIFENPQAELKTLVECSVLQVGLQEIADLFLAILRHFKAHPDEHSDSLVGSSESLRRFFALVGLASTRPSLGLTELSWFPALKSTSSDVVDLILDSNLLNSIFDLREDSGLDAPSAADPSKTDALTDDEGGRTWGSGGSCSRGSGGLDQTFLLNVLHLYSSGAQAALVEYAVIARLVPDKCADIVMQRLAHFAGANGEAASLNHLFWLMCFANEFIRETSDTNLDSEKPKSIPLAFLQNRDCEQKIIQLCTGVSGFVSSLLASLPTPDLTGATSSAASSPALSRVIQASIAVIMSFLNVYLLRGKRYGDSFALLSEQSTAESALNNLVGVVYSVILMLPHDPNTVHIAITCLNSVASPYNPCETYLWECANFKELIAGIVSLAHDGLPSDNSPKESSSSSLRLLPHKSIRKLCCAVALATGSSEFTKGVARQHEAVLRRSGSALANELSDVRHSQLLTLAQPLHDSLMGRCKSGAAGLCEPTAALILSVLAGFVKGAGYQHPAETSMWLMASLVPQLYQTLSSTPDPYQTKLPLPHLTKLMKNLGRLCLALPVTDENDKSVKTHLATVRLLAHLAAARNRVMSARLDELRGLFKSLALIVSTWNQRSDAANSSLLIFDFVLPTLGDLEPCLRRTEKILMGSGTPQSGSSDNLVASYNELQTKLMQLDGERFFQALTPARTDFVMQSIQKGLASDNGRTKLISSDALEACLSYVVEECLKSGQNISFERTPPAPPSPDSDLFSVPPCLIDASNNFTRSSDAIVEAITYHVAHIGLQELIGAMTKTAVVSSNSTFLEDLISDEICDILCFLGLKATNLLRFFQQFITLYSLEVPIDRRETVGLSCLRAAEPLVNLVLHKLQKDHEILSQRSEDSVHMVRTLNLKFRNDFRAHFRNFLLTCRVEASSSDSRPS